MATASLPRRAATLAAVAVLVSLPFVEGVIGPWIFVPVLAVGLAAAGWASRRGSEYATRVVLILCAAAVTSALFDVGLRVAGIGRPVILQRWPAMPLTIRYIPGMDRGDVDDHDLARMSGVPPIDEGGKRHLVTDAAGFRNLPGARERDIDVVLLGGSVGAGAANQDDTIAAGIERGGLATYNLSTPGTSPWQEYVNLYAELPHLRLRPHAAIVWLVFPANALHGDYGSLDMNRLPWKGSVEQWIERARGLRARSPLRRAFERNEPSRDVMARTFIDGGPLLFYTPYIDDPSRDASALVDPKLAAFHETLAAFARLARERGLRPVVLLVPAKERVYSWVYTGQAPWTRPAAASALATDIARMCADLKMTCEDLDPVLAAESRRLFETTGDLVYRRDDTHFNVVGNRIVAQRALALVRTTPP